SSGHIIEEQIENVKKKTESLEAMHCVRNEAFRMKNCLLRGELLELGKALNTSWENKKKMARNITNETINKIYETAMQNGALGGKISGAGGGGFMFFYCSGNSCYDVAKALSDLKLGEICRFEFSKKGLTTWTVKT
ncbi:MAG: hypothetical protein FWG22_05235, partial [Prolixibacteraceae bacterium]|nr:hypothetical protein [Prolixibacteraceae bacterium]